MSAAQWSRRTRWRSLLVILVAVSWMGNRGIAEEATASVEALPVAPQVSAVKVDCPPTVDGRLDDACWQQATHVVSFWRMENRAAEYEPTEAWICYDRDCLYIAWYCHDSQPEKIVAQQKKRGGSLLGDDWVGIDLDVDYDQQNPYWFDVSAGGIQVESIPGGSAAKTEWRGDWRGAATRVSDGWQAEMALPLSIFRYPKGQSTFGFVLIRRLAREDDWSVWPNIGPGFEITRQAAWTGLELPAPKEGPAIMPYTLAEFGNTGREGATAGLDIKHRFQNGLQGQFAYNPDFRDVEDVVETIDFTYVERYLPEYRPFFLDGSGYQPYSGLFYSRRIADFDGGVKLFGQTGKHSLGALFTSDVGNAANWAIRERYYATPYQQFGASLVGHEATEDPRNVAYEVNVDRRYPRTDGDLAYWAAWRGTSTEGLGGDGSSMGCGLGRSRSIGRSWDVSWNTISAGFNPVLGYTPEVAIHKLSAGLTDHQRYDSVLLSRDWYTYLNNGASPKGSRWSTGIGVGVSRRDQREYNFEIEVGARDGFNEYTAYSHYGWGSRDLYRNGGIYFEYGERLTNPYRYLSLSQATQLGNRLSLQVRAEHVSASFLNDDGTIAPVESVEQYVLTTTYDLTWERSVSARLVAREGGTNWYLAFRQKTRLGTDAWLIFGDPNADHFTRRLAVKLVRVF